MPANKNALIRYKTIDNCLRNRYKLGYNAPIEVYDRIYYRYADPNYSITEMPLSADDCKLIKEAITLLGNKEATIKHYIQNKNVTRERLNSRHRHSECRALLRPSSESHHT